MPQASAIAVAEAAGHEGTAEVSLLAAAGIKLSKPAAAKEVATATAASADAEGDGAEGEKAPAAAKVASEEKGQSHVEWVTEELRAARSVLMEQSWIESRAPQLAEARLQMLRTHIEGRARLPVRAAEILGTDGRMRRYLTFPHDPQVRAVPMHSPACTCTCTCATCTCACARTRTRWLSTNCSQSLTDAAPPHISFCLAARRAAGVG